MNIDSIREHLLSISAKSRGKYIRESKEVLDLLLQHYNGITSDISEIVALIVHNVEKPRCASCGNFVKWHGSINKYKNTCSAQCMNKLTDFNERTQKIKETNLKKYGVECSLQLDITKERRKEVGHTDKWRESVTKANKKSVGKIRKTIKEKYGVENISQLSEVREKVKLTNLQKYGSEHYSQSIEYKNRMILEAIDTFQQYTSKGTVQDIIRPTKEGIISKIKYYCNTCQKEEIMSTETFKWRIRGYDDPCKKCVGIQPNRSLKEQEVAEYVSTLIDIECNIRIDNKEADILIPSKNLAIEFDGIYHHSVENGKDKLYHINKTKHFNELGYDLIHVFEDEWNYKQEIVKSVIRNKLGIITNKVFARKCTVKEISTEEARAFIDTYHLYGYKKAKVKLGLFYNNELIQVMTFSTGNHSRKQNGWEIDRFATKFDYQVIGGASKLFKHFIKNHNPEEIISYADLRYGEGNVYKQLGFELLGNTQPSYYYVKGTKRIHRYALRKTKEENLSGKTEFELRAEQGYCRIYDCGHNKWQWKKK